MQAILQTRERAAAVLDDCRAMVLSAMRKSLQLFFENSDMAFQEFAGKAQSGNSQIRFMEAMNIIGRNRARVESTYLDCINAGFSAFGRHPDQQPVAAHGHLDRLSLQTLEESDIQVAIQNMIDSATVGCSHTLNAIRQRLSVLNGGRMVAEDAIPGGPFNLASAFHTALQDIPLEHEIRLVVYFLYDRVVLRKTHILYEEYNQRLIKAGILPNLIFEVRRNPKQAQDAAQRETGHDDGQQQNPGSGQSLADGVFQDILTLLSRKNRFTTTAGDSGYPHVEPANPLPRNELVSALSELQRDHGQTEPSLSNVEIATAHSKTQQDRIISGMINRLTQERDRLFSGLDRRRLPSADIHLIELVGMMFEYMLRDENIPSIAKAELSRLHTPYLKVAVLDKTLFTDSGHPAHALLNALAEAASKWVFVNNLERGVFPCLCHIVQRINDDFDSNLALFSELLEFLGNTVTNLENRAAAIEERSRQAATGKEKLAMARDRAARAIESRVTGHRVPNALRSILGDIWLDKLMFIYLREPETDRSPAWKLAIQAIETIVWSVEPRDTDQERSELRQRIADLNVQLAGTLETLAIYGNSDNSDQLALIHDLQATALQGEPMPEEAPAPDNEPGPAISADAATSLPADRTADNDTTATGGGQAVDDSALTEVEEQALELLRNIKFGSWFAFEQEGDVPAQRLKLSWFSRVSGNYMFVDGMGVRALTCKHHELATMVADGRARILDGATQPLIQRALRTIRKLLGGSSHTPE